LDETFNKAFDAIKELMEDFMIKTISGEGNTASYNTLLNRYKDLIRRGEAGEIKPERLAENITKDIEKFLESNNFTR